MSAKAKTPGHAVFAYGSNMHLRDLERWMGERDLGAPRVNAAWPAVLPDFRLAWCYRSPVREGGAANVVPAAGAEVPGLVLRVDDHTFAALDRKEQHPTHYDRGPEPMQLRHSSGEPLTAWVYQVTEAWVCPEPEWPRSHYLRLLVEAAREHRLPRRHVDELLRTPTVHPHVGAVVRPAEPRDARALAHVHAESDSRGDPAVDRARDPQTLATAWEEALGSESPATSTWVAERDKEVTALARVRAGESGSAGERACEIDAIAALPSEYGRGVGRALMERISWLLEGRPAVAWVPENNARARRFFEKAGFQPEGSIREAQASEPAARSIRMRRPAD